MDAAASHIWQSSLVAAVAAMLAWLLRDNRAAVRFWIWVAASVKFLVPFAAVSAAAGAVPWPHVTSTENDAVSAITVLFTSAALPGFLEPYSQSMVMVWLAGTIVLLARWAREWNRIAAAARAAAPVSEGPVLEALRRAERAAGRRAPTSIVWAPHAVEPGVIGIRHPILMWPRHLAERMQRDHVEPVIAHELAHIGRRDNLMASLHMLVCAAFWFNPIVWWIGARLVEERERACDEQVLALGQSPSAYAGGILKTCELCVAARLANVPGVTGGDLKRRIGCILRNEPGAPLSAAKRAALFIALALVAGTPILAGVSKVPPRIAAAQDADEPQVYRPGRDVKPPSLRKEVRPHYSDRAKQEKVEGEVLMECVVKADGTVGDIRIVRPLHPDLDQAAVDAARQWEFEPGTRNGKPVDVLVTIAMSFTLK